MAFKQVNKIISLLLIVGLISCVDEFDFETQAGFESAIVIEATITNEFKTQEIRLTRTFRLEEDGPQAEADATVTVTEGESVTYNFTDMGEGVYLSTEEFKAQPNRDYQLNIITSDGRTYASEIIQLTASTELDAIVPTRQTNDNSVDGVSLLVNSYDPTGASKYYKYEYEETYKIISRIKTDSVFKLVPTNSGEDLVTVVPREIEEDVCYNTRISDALILTTTSGLEEDRVSQFPVRFISKRDPIVANGYSILVKQYTLSLEAYTFYETLRDFSGSGSIFSQTQPGFIRGNIKSTQNPDEKVIGFFNVSSFSSQRVFFKFLDVFSSTDIPGTFSPECPETRPGLDLRMRIRANTIRFLRTATASEPAETGEGPYFVVPRFCVDCRFFGSLEVPDFWED